MHWLNFGGDYSRSISWKLEPPPPPSLLAWSGCCCEPDEDGAEVEVEDEVVDGPADDDELEVAFEVLLVVEEEAVEGGAVWLGGILK